MSRGTAGAIPHPEAASAQLPCSLIPTRNEMIFANYIFRPRLICFSANTGASDTEVNGLRTSPARSASRLGFCFNAMRIFDSISH